MPRKSRSQLLGKCHQVEQELRREALRRFARKLRFSSQPINLSEIASTSSTAPSGSNE